MNEKRAVIRAVCISEKKGEQKHAVDRIMLRPGHGIVGDAHAGNWHRQVSLLGCESVAKLQEKVSVQLYPVGTKLRIGCALCEVTQIGKKCHADCAIRRQAGDCVMPREGIFAVVLEAGCAQAGDIVEIVG